MPQASNTDEALEVVAKGGSIDLLLTDVIMSGMSGSDVAKKLCSRRPRMRVLFMSGYTDGAIEVHGDLKPGLVVRRKPSTRDTLLHAVDNALSEQPRCYAAH